MRRPLNRIAFLDHRPILHREHVRDVSKVWLVLAAWSEPDRTSQKLMLCFSFFVVLFFAHISLLPRSGS